MPFPFVSRERYDEMLRFKDRELAGHEARLRKLELVLARIVDKNFMETCGVQLFGTAPRAEAGIPAHDAESEMVSNLKQEDDEAQRDREELASLRKTNPSRVGTKIQQMAAKRALRSIHAVHGTPNSEAHKLFAEAAKQ